MTAIIICQYNIGVVTKYCSHPPLKSDPNNYCLFHSHHDKKNTKAFWKGIHEKMENEDFDFEGYCFPPSLAADFSKKKFKDANFMYARFKGGVDFRFATFEGIADFRGGIFEGECVNFSWARFLGKTHFNAANFLECGTTLFVDTFFGSMCEFLGVEFPLRSDQYVIFKGSSYPLRLHNIILLYSNYDRMLFRNCKFLEGPDEIIGRRFPLWKRKTILPDELLVFTKPIEGWRKAKQVEYSHVESLYRQLKKNFEAEKDWEMAGEFHYGEMECKRKGLKLCFWRVFGLLAWYKYFSGYGERPWRALCWVIFLLLFFAGIYCGLDTPPRECFWNHYFWEISVKAAFLQRIGETGNEPISIWGKLIYLFQSALCPILITLFILALRRKVRR